MTSLGSTPISNQSRRSGDHGCNGYRAALSRLPCSCCCLSLPCQSSQAPPLYLCCYLAAWPCCLGCPGDWCSAYSGLGRGGLDRQPGHRCCLLNPSTATQE